MINDIAYHADGHQVKSDLRHYPANENTKDFCVLSIDFMTSENETVSRIQIIIEGKIAEAKTHFSAIKAAL
jgi:hypothetical protein